MPKQDTFETEQLTDAAFYILLSLTDKGRILLRHELTRRETIVTTARKIMMEKGI